MEVLISNNYGKNLTNLKGCITNAPLYVGCHVQYFVVANVDEGKELECTNIVTRSEAIRVNVFPKSGVIKINFGLYSLNSSSQVLRFLNDVGFVSKESFIFHVKKYLSAGATSLYANLYVCWHDSHCSDNLYFKR